MVSQVVQSANFVTIPSQPAPGSILDIAQVIDGLPWGDGVGLIESFNCIGVDVDLVNCSTYKSLTKRFDGPSNGNGTQFVVQGGVTCKPFGFDMNDPRLAAAFNAVEPEGVSIGLHDGVLVNGTDLTPAAGSVSPVQALGVLEGAGRLNYAGAPVIHAGPALASMWAGIQAVHKVGNHLETLLGTQIAVSVGNESKTAGKLDADQWAFVTGAVVLWRSQAQPHSAIDQATNDITVLYERVYTAAVDCLVAKVKVKVL